MFIRFDSRNLQIWTRDTSSVMILIKSTIQIALMSIAVVKIKLKTTYNEKLPPPSFN